MHACCPASPLPTWLITMVLSGTPSCLSELASRLLSLTAMMVGMVTMTNSVDSGLRNSCRASSCREQVRQGQAGEGASEAGGAMPGRRQRAAGATGRE